MTGGGADRITNNAANVASRTLSTIGKRANFEGRHADTMSKNIYSALAIASISCGELAVALREQNFTYREITQHFRTIRGELILNKCFILLNQK